jgi:hypothetical protein
MKFRKIVSEGLQENVRQTKNTKKRYFSYRGFRKKVHTHGDPLSTKNNRARNILPKEKPPLQESAFRPLFLL